MTGIVSERLIAAGHWSQLRAEAPPRGGLPVVLLCASRVSILPSVIRGYRA